LDRVTQRGGTKCDTFCKSTKLIWIKSRTFLPLFSPPPPPPFLSTHNRPGAIALGAVIHNAALRNAVQLCAENATFESETDSVRFFAMRCRAKLSTSSPLRERICNFNAIMISLWQGKKRRKKESERISSSRTRTCPYVWRLPNAMLRRRFYTLKVSGSWRADGLSLFPPFFLSFFRVLLRTAALFVFVWPFFTRDNSYSTCVLGLRYAISSTRHRHCFSWTWESSGWRLFDKNTARACVRACVRSEATCSRRYSLPIRTDSNKRHRPLFRSTAVQWGTEVRSIVCNFSVGFESRPSFTSLFIWFARHLWNLRSLLYPNKIILKIIISIGLLCITYKNRNIIRLFSLS